MSAPRQGETIQGVIQKSQLDRRLEDLIGFFSAFDGANRNNQRYLQLTQGANFIDFAEHVQGIIAGLRGDLRYISKEMPEDPNERLVRAGMIKGALRDIHQHSISKLVAKIDGFLKNQNGEGSVLRGHEKKLLEDSKEHLNVFKQALEPFLSQEAQNHLKR